MNIEGREKGEFETTVGVTTPMRMRPEVKGKMSRSEGGMAIPCHSKKRKRRETTSIETGTETPNSKLLLPRAPPGKSVETYSGRGGEFNTPSQNRVNPGRKVKGKVTDKVSGKLADKFSRKSK